MTEEKGTPVFLGIAVWDTAYTFDRLFTYRAAQPVAIGCRVIVPFGRGNRARIGMVLEKQQPPETAVKSILTVVDDAPVLQAEQLELVFWLREMTFCTYCDAIRTILPAGMQLQIAEKTVLAEPLPDVLLSPEESALYCALRQAGTEAAFQKRLQHPLAASLFQKGVLVSRLTAKPRVQEPLVKMVSLPAVLPVHRMTPKQQQLIKLLQESGTLPEKEACRRCNITRAVVQTAEKNGLVVCKMQLAERNTTGTAITEDVHAITLSAAQQRVMEQVLEKINASVFTCFLLHGVTGSGKTRVFQKLIAATLQMGKQAIVLVPEIALTPQIVGQFQQLFGDAVVVMHSELSDRQRQDAYHRMQTGTARIAIGTRSAVFAPVKSLGLMIVDEEGERTYKSDNAPRYHAIAVAKKRCQTHHCPLLLASATPSIESYYYAQKGIYTLLELKQRYRNMPLPEVTTVDMNQERQRGNTSAFSTELLQAIQDTIAVDKQALLLLNRRGYYTIISCCQCNQPVYCPNCSVPMTYHKVSDQLMCHYCGHMQPMVTTCPHCGNGQFRRMGLGTQQMEEQLQTLFPTARILRMDADTTVSRYAYEEKFTAFREKAYDIMIGTQMIGKGLDFPDVTLVGVLSVDNALFAGDFRSYERTFSLITQVVGRSGRGTTAGRAILQTFLPDHYVLQLAARQNYPAFYEQEISIRKALLFPPFCDLCVLTFVGEQETCVADAAREAVQQITRYVKQTGFSLPLWVLGAVPCPYERLKGKYRYRVILKCKNTAPYRALVRTVLAAVTGQKAFSKLHCYADMNGDIGV
jgi:primosomal protein N' (replication factor Y)